MPKEREEREERVTYLGLLWVSRSPSRWFLEDMLAQSKSATSNDNDGMYEPDNL
jgi:hypothetical protein